MKFRLRVTDLIINSILVILSILSWLFLLYTKLLRDSFEMTANNFFLSKGFVLCLFLLIPSFLAKTIVGFKFNSNDKLNNLVSVICLAVIILSAFVLFTNFNFYANELEKYIS